MLAPCGDEFMAKIAAKGLVDHLERPGFVMKRPKLLGQFERITGD
jgi:hypothetical protein